MKLLTTKKVNFIILFAFCCIFVISCEKKEQVEKVPVTEQADTLIDNEGLDYLLKQRDFMEFVTLLRKLDFPPIDCAAAVEQYDKKSDRPKMLIRFGMLCTDIAYKKIIEKKTQIPEYDNLFQKYVKDLNISNFFKNSIEQYINEISAKKFNDSSFNELIAKFKADKAKLVNDMKYVDEEFLIFSYIGVVTEIDFILFNLKSKDEKSYKKIMPKFVNYINDSSILINNFYSKLLKKIENNPKYASYKDYILKVKPTYEGYLEFSKVTGASRDSLEQKLITMNKDLRVEFLK